MWGGGRALVPARPEQIHNTATHTEWASSHADADKYSILSILHLLTTSYYFKIHYKITSILNTLV